MSENEETSIVAGEEGQRAARELAEGNALARVFEDVRAQSREGLLVQPTRWPEIGLVPDHMDPEEFEMFVYGYWEEHEARDGSGADVCGEPAAQAQAGGSSRVKRVSTARSSTIGSVGVPPFLRKAAAESAPADERADAGEASASGKPAEAWRDAPAVSFHAGEGEHPSAPRCEGGSAVDVVDDDGNPYGSLRLPEGYKLVQLEGEWALVPDDDAEPVQLEIDSSNIVALVGRYSYYLYDRTLMTDSFAHWSFLAAEGDDALTFADCVREESRTYPRPMPIESLENDPFRFSEERILRIWDHVRASGEYPDIEQVVASNGDIFFYSTRYLTPEYAASLAEWAAVERLRNV